MDPEDERHGTLNGYNRQGCRCSRCRRANADRQAARRERRAAPKHGTYSAYSNHACRCDLCVAAATALQRDHQSSRQDRTLDRASNRGKPWTGPELEIALREDLTAAEAALMLGRTFAGVQTQRHLSRRDPRKIKLAGVNGGAS